MSERATAYVRGLGLPDAAERLFLLLAERTRSSSYEDRESPMGLLLEDADLPALAAQLGTGVPELRERLRALKTAVRMDVLEHRDGAFEIVYGPCYTDRPKTAARAARGEVGAVQAFTLPGWERYSTWGLEEVHGRRDLGHMYAQLYRNTDNPNDAPRIWITPPRHVLTTVDELADAIAAQIAPYMPVTMPGEVLKTWLKY
jgi:hypothetical protein